MNKPVQVFEGDGDRPISVNDVAEQLYRVRYSEGYYPEPAMEVVASTLRNASPDVLAEVTAKLSKIPSQRPLVSAAKHEKMMRRLRRPAWRRYPEHLALAAGILLGLGTLSAAVMTYNERPASVFWVLGIWAAALAIAGLISTIAAHEGS